MTSSLLLSHSGSKRPSCLHGHQSPKRSLYLCPCPPRLLSTGQHDPVTLNPTWPLATASHFTHSEIGGWCRATPFPSHPLSLVRPSWPSGSSLRELQGSLLHCLHVSAPMSLLRGAPEGCLLRTSGPCHPPSVLCFLVSYINSTFSSPQPPKCTTYFTQFSSFLCERISGTRRVGFVCSLLYPQHPEGSLAPGCCIISF